MMPLKKRKTFGFFLASSLSLFWQESSALNGNTVCCRSLAPSSLFFFCKWPFAPQHSTVPGFQLQSRWWSGPEANRAQRQSVFQAGWPQFLSLLLSLETSLKEVSYLHLLQSFWGIDLIIGPEKMFAISYNLSRCQSWTFRFLRIIETSWVILSVCFQNSLGWCLYNPLSQYTMEGMWDAVLCLGGSAGFWWWLKEPSTHLEQLFIIVLLLSASLSNLAFLKPGLMPSRLASNSLWCWQWPWTVLASPSQCWDYSCAPPHMASVSNIKVDTWT